MSLRSLLVAACAVVVTAHAARAQAPFDVGPLQATRPALESLLTRLEDAASSGTFSGRVAARARRQADQVRERLREGDLQIGDRVRLIVAQETSLTDTFTVQPGRVLDLPNVGRVSLAGVLRAELRAHLTQFLARFIRDPDVQVQPLIRVSVLGDVVRQGFYTVPTDILVDDLLMAAGGPTGAAQLDRMRLERWDGEVVWDSEELQRAVTQGLTLDALSLQAGDRLVIPPRRARNVESIVRTVGIVLTIPFTIYGLTQLF